MRDTVNVTQRNQSGAKTRRGASLSVVVVSSGSAIIAQQATRALQTASRDLVAQIILVSQERDRGFVSSVERLGAELVVAPTGSSRAEMCDLGMKRVHGSIVAVRDDVSVGDARWLAAYRAVLPQHEAVAQAVPMESVVMNTAAPRRVALADAPPSLSKLDATTGPSIELASAL